MLFNPNGTKKRAEESPLGSITLLRDLQAKIKIEDEKTAIQLAHAKANEGVGKGRRNSIDLQFQMKNKGLELFPVMSEARRKSDAMAAREIAIERAKEKVMY